MAFLSSLIAALPCFGAAAVFLITWIDPSALGDRVVDDLVLVMLVEFFVVHSSAFMAGVLVADEPQRAKLKRLLGLGVFYAGMIAVLAAGFETWWPLVAFAVLTLTKVMSVLLAPATSREQRDAVQAGWVVSTLAYLVFAGGTVMVPVPKLGITRGLDMDASGLWVDEPHRVVAAGFLYFLTLGIAAIVIPRRTRAARSPSHGGPAIDQERPAIG